MLASDDLPHDLVKEDSLNISQSENFLRAKTFSERRLSLGPKQSGLLTQEGKEAGDQSLKMLLKRSRQAFQALTVASS